MPDIGEFHPQIVHFAVALLFSGVLARLAALLPLPERWRFLGPGATTLIVAASRDAPRKRLDLRKNCSAPEDVEVRLLALESLLKDRREAAATLAGLDSLNLAPDNRRLRIRAGILRADALSGAGQADSARALLELLAREFPDSPTLQLRMQQTP